VAVPVNAEQAALRTFTGRDGDVAVVASTVPWIEQQGVDG
jgi:hypothetical protein